MDDLKMGAKLILNFEHLLVVNFFIIVMIQEFLLEFINEVCQICLHERLY